MSPVSGRKVPKFKTLHDEAEFWDEHSPLDYPSEFEEVEDVRFVRPPKEVMTLRMDKATIDLIKRVARKMGMQPTSLARAWLVERVTHEARMGKRSAKRTSRATQATV